MHAKTMLGETRPVEGPNARREGENEEKEFSGNVLEIHGEGSIENALGLTRTVYSVSVAALYEKDAHLDR
jgi:hypothetical protein